MDDNLNSSSICNTIASSLTNVVPGAGGDRIHHGCQAGKTWVRVAALGAKGIDATYSTAAESISIDIDQGISLETSTVMTEGDGYMNQVAGSHINAQFDCAKSFRDRFCTSKQKADLLRIWRASKRSALSPKTHHLFALTPPPPSAQPASASKPSRTCLRSRAPEACPAGPTA